MPHLLMILPQIPTLISLGSFRLLLNYLGFFLLLLNYLLQKITAKNIKDYILKHLFINSKILTHL